MDSPKNVLTEPYRLFFPIGWGMALIGTTYWLLVALGAINHYAPLYHGLIQIELFCAAFALGFLLTALPKFLRTRAATSIELSTCIVVYSLLAGILLTNEIVASQWAFILLMMVLARFALIRFLERKALPPYSFLLVAVGFVSGILGALLIIAPSSTFPLLGPKLIEQGMFLCLSLGVGSFLGPRLMGVVDTTNAVVSLPGRASNTVAWWRSPFTVTAIIGLVLFGSFFIETGFHRELGMSLRAAASLYCLQHFGVLKLPRTRSPVGICAALSLWAMVLGIAVGTALPAHEVGALHLTYMGGFGFLIMTIGAQVISSHGGVHNFWQNYKTWMIAIAALVGVATVLRAAASLHAEHYFALLGIASGIFDLALIIWGMVTLRYLQSGLNRPIR